VLLQQTEYLVVTYVDKNYAKWLFLHMNIATYPVPLL